MSRILVIALLLAGVSARVASQSGPRAAGVLQGDGGVTTRAAQVPTPQRPQPAPVTQLDLNQRDPNLDGDRISIVFERPIAVRDVLILLVRGTRLSLVPDPGAALDQRLVADLKNVTLREALDAVLEPLGLDYSLRGRLLRVFPRELDTQLYDVDYVATPAVEGSSDFYADLEGGVRALLSTEGRMHLDRTASLLQVTDRPRQLQRVEAYVQAALRRAARQIQLDATAVEVELKDATSAGIDWNAVTSRLAPAAASRRSQVLTLPSGSIQPVLQALGELGSLRVLARARIVAMNNQPTFIRSESSEAFSLSVTGQVSSSGLIQMRVHPRVTERMTSGEGADAQSQPVLRVRETDTQVRVRAGETIVLSGFTQTTNRPDAGRVRTDLVILLTPTIVSPGVTVADARP